MTESDLDRVHADLLLAEKRTAVELKTASANLTNMARLWNSATESASHGRTPSLAVNSDGRLFDNRYPASSGEKTLLPTELELAAAVKSCTELKVSLDGIKGKLSRFS